jgi:DNA-binding protein H-NS
MTLESLEKLQDNELQAVIARAGELLKQHDQERKEKAIAEAGAILAAAGLSLKDVARKTKSAKHGGDRGPAYHAGHRYQHPAKKELVWNAKGQKPGWLRQLEAEGKKAVELAAA